MAEYKLEIRPTPNEVVYTGEEKYIFTVPLSESDAIIYGMGLAFQEGVDIHNKEITFWIRNEETAEWEHLEP